MVFTFHKFAILPKYCDRCNCRFWLQPYNIKDKSGYPWYTNQYIICVRCIVEQIEEKEKRKKKNKDYTEF